MEITDKLVEKDLLNEEKASHVKERAEEEELEEEEVILEESLVPEEELFKVKSELLGVSLRGDVSKEDIPGEVLDLLNRESIEHFKMIPIGKEEDGTVRIGMVFPEDLRAQQALKFTLKRKNIPYEIHLLSLSKFNELTKTLKEGSSEEEAQEEPSYEDLQEEDLSEEGTLEKPKDKGDEDVVALLAGKGFLNEEQKKEVKEKAEREERNEEEVILEEDLVSEEDLFNVKSEVVDFPLKEDVEVEAIPEDVLDLIHEDSVDHYKMIPIGKEGEQVQIGMVHPEDLKAQEALRFISRQKIFSYKVYLIPLSLFERTRKRFRVMGKDLSAVLLDDLVEGGFLDEEKKEEIEKKSEKSEKPKEEVILEEEFLSEEDLFKVKSEVVETPLKEEVNEENVTEELLKLFSRDEMNHYRMIPIEKREDGVIEVGMVYPEDPGAVEALDFLSRQGNFEYEIRLITLSDFKKAAKKVKKVTKEAGSLLTEKLVEKEFIDDEEANSIDSRAESGEKSREELILDQKLVSEEDLFKVKSEVTGVPFKDDVDVKGIPENILRVIPEDSANYYRMAPIGKEDDAIQVGMIHPEDLRAKEALRFLARRDDFSYKIYLISLSTFEEISKQYRTLSEEVGKALEDLDTELEETEEEEVTEEEDIGKLAEEAPIVKVVGVILRNAVEGSASDIHIEPTRDKLKVRFRVDGELHSSLFLPGGTHLAAIARIKILAGLKIDEQRLPQDGRFSSKIGDKTVDFRVATLPTTLGEKAVIRVLDPTQGLKTVEELGVSGKNYQVLNSAMKKPTGMLLVTGPTGSGKTTTLYSAMRILNEDRVNIVTLEDPVEYFIDGVNQSQVNPDIGYVFSSGLRQILRQDPDIIMVGEIRDEETADLAVHAALTGHIVLSTLHTNDATGVVHRLIDMGIKPFLIPPSLNTSMAQRLVKRLCDKCKEEVEPSDEIKAMIGEELEKLPKEALQGVDPSSFKVYKANGCKHCSEEGFEGRIGIFELFKMTEDIGEVVMRNPTEKELKAEVKKQGMVDLKKDGFLKVIQGYTTIEEVLRATEEK